MSTWAIIATGQSLTADDVEHVRGRCPAIAISNAYQLAPWADCLVSHDRAWWQQHPEAKEFSGRRYCKFEERGCLAYSPPEMPMGCNSGLMGAFIARDLGATRILLLGFDMHGTHYFGAHPEPLANTTESRFQRHIAQFDGFTGAEMINCTPGSALKRFPFVPLREALC